VKLQEVVVCFVLSIGAAHCVYADGFLLEVPPVISKIAIDEKIDTVNMGMVWGGKSVKTGESWDFGFDQKHGKTLFKIQIVGNLPTAFTKKELAKFKKSTNNGETVWTYTFGGSDNQALNEEKSSSVEEVMGTVAKPLVVNKRMPRIMFNSEIARLIRNKKVIFYTGAGISAGVVPTMSQLMQRLGLDFDFFKNEKIRDSFIQRALENSASFTKVMDDFYSACFYGKPTAAHKAIRDIVNLKNWGLLTENLDFLHQRTGLNPLNHGMPNWLKANVTPKDLKKIDFVITVGLASDESGFLAWYKQHNPKGVIIAVNLKKPNYLNNQDIFISGDAQIILPDLFKDLKVENKVKL
jgi:NAD-dependent SIR2 family protein deacetylase